MAAGPAEAPTRQCISQISKCKAQNFGMAFGHDFIFLKFDGLAGKSETVTLSWENEIPRSAQNDEICDFLRVRQF